VSLAALYAIAGYGYVRGQADGRFVDGSQRVRVAAALARLPTEFGSWRGVDTSAADAAELRRAGAEHHLLRRYEDGAGGAAVTVLAMVGPANLLALHSPDVCYTAGGEFHLSDGAAGTHDFDGGAMAHGRFASTVGAPRHVSVCWTYFDGAGWKAPATPRLAFAGAPYLIKLYLVEELPEGVGREPRWELAESVATWLGAAAQPTPEVR
jgi:hypothetical protein